MDRVKETHVEPDDWQHKASPWCWCQPVVEEVPPDGRIYIHRRFIDGPAYEKPRSDVSVSSSGS
jgi:hypothetical protein